MSQAVQQGTFFVYSRYTERNCRIVMKMKITGAARNSGASPMLLPQQNTKFARTSNFFVYFLGTRKRGPNLVEQSRHPNLELHID